MTATLDLFAVVAAPRSVAPKPEKVAAQHYAAFGGVWIELEDVADEVARVTAKHAAIAARLDDPALLEQIGPNDPRRREAEARLFRYTSERSRHMNDFRRLALRIHKLFSGLPEDVQAGIVERAYATIGPSAAMEVAGKDHAVMGHATWRRLVSAWHRGKGLPEANPESCPF